VAVRHAEASLRPIQHFIGTTPRKARLSNTFFSPRFTLNAAGRQAHSPSVRYQGKGTRDSIPQAMVALSTFSRKISGSRIVVIGVEHSLRKIQLCQPIVQFR